KLSKTSLTPDRWHDVTFKWDTSAGILQVVIDGQEAGTLRANGESDCIVYLRIRSTAESTDVAGMLIQSAETEIASVRCNIPVVEQKTRVRFPLVGPPPPQA